jgi:hypothetical protein
MGHGRCRHGMGVLRIDNNARSSKKHRQFGFLMPAALHTATDDLIFEHVESFPDFAGALDDAGELAFRQVHGKPATGAGWNAGKAALRRQA